MGTFEPLEKRSLSWLKSIILELNIRKCEKIKQVQELAVFIRVLILLLLLIAVIASCNG